MIHHLTIAALLLTFTVLACNKVPLPTETTSETTSLRAGKLLAATGNESPATATDLGNWTNSTGGSRANETLRNPNSDSKNYYQFVLDEEKEIRIQVKKQETEHATLAIVDEDDNTIFGANSRGWQGSGANTKYDDGLSWTVIGPGTWYIRIAQSNNTDNTFDLTWNVREAPSLPSDDFSAGIWTDGEVQVGVPVDGTIASSSVRYDHDWFAIDITELVEGRHKFEVESATRKLLFLRDEYGHFVLPLLEFAAYPRQHEFQTTGKYFVEVRGRDGDYKLLVLPPLPRNSKSEPSGQDFSGDTSTKGYIKVNGRRATGTLSAEDLDYFKILLREGKSYQIDAKGHAAGDYGGTYSLTLGIALQDRTGASLTNTDDAEPFDHEGPAEGRFTGSIIPGVPVSNKLGGVGANGRLKIHVYTTGIYFIAVYDPDADEDTPSGTYTLIARTIE